MESLFLLSCQIMYARLTIDFRRDIELVKLDLLIVLRCIHELRCVDAMATQVIYYSIAVMKNIQSQRFKRISLYNVFVFVQKICQRYLVQYRILLAVADIHEVSAH